MSFSPLGADNSVSRLQRYISSSGYCARRKAADLIAAGRVSVNGAVCKEPWHPVSVGDQVRVDGVGLPEPQKKRFLYLAVHKPVGYLTTNRDPEGRPCVSDLVRSVYSDRLFHVGRLDKNSGGLILLTNDGDFSQFVQHPSSGIEKEYRVKVSRRIPPFVLEQWRRGIVIEGIRYQLHKYRLLGDREVELVLLEGLNREIRRVFEHFDIALRKIHRFRIGPVHLKGLPSGTFRALNAYELRSFRAKRLADHKKASQKKFSREPKSRKVRVR